MGQKILIIEDEKALAEEWAKGLQYAGYETKIVTTLNEVMNILNQLDFDLVLLDIMLPSYDVSDRIKQNSIKWGRIAGLWIAKQIKEREPSMPIFVVSLVTDQKILDELKQVGVVKVVSKPISVKELIDIVESCLGKV
ncbi:MAG: response regulator [Thermodesulfobacteriota bacterium]|nr:response regulator [Thermodesulfobacteriota bacterium]